MSAGKRGCEVVLVEAGRQLGGRATTEAALPGLASWRRVVDHRLEQMDRLPNVEWYLESEMTADEALTYDFDHIAVATGSTWRSDGVGIHHRVPLEFGAMPVLTPDDLLAGRRPDGSVVLFDDDHFYLGGAIAEHLADLGVEVHLLTSAAEVSPWTENTMEQRRVHRRLRERGVHLHPFTVLTGARDGTATTLDVVTGASSTIEAGSLVLATSRTPRTELADALLARHEEWNGLATVRLVGDADTPGTIAHAVWDGRRWAEELDGVDDDALYRRNPARLA